VNLAIDVGLGYVIHVNDRDVTDTTAGKRFGGPRANAADSNNCDMGTTHCGCAIDPIQAIKPRKSTTEVRFIGGQERCSQD
jgi:hypothetical protein